MHRSIIVRLFAIAGLALTIAASPPQGPAAASPPGAMAGAWPIVEGKLANGLRYAILPRHANEPGTGMLMRVEGGFLAERRPGERGLAHLIEHIAFRSPTTAAPDQFGRFMEIGLPLTFPAPSAATTTWQASDYFVSSRTARPADLATLLGLFREVASELTFRADAVDGQRADVMREMAERQPGNAVYARYIAAVAPGSPTDVIDAQNSDDVPTASIATIRGLYRRLYRPENTTVVVVGNVDPAAIVVQIARTFGDWRGEGLPVLRPIPAFRRERIAPLSFAALPDRRSAMVSLVVPTPRPAATPRGRAEAVLIDRIAAHAASTRLAGAVGGAPGTTGLVIEHGEQGHRLFLMWDDYPADGWRPAVAALAATSCALRTGGFTEVEWAAAKADVVRDLEREERAAPANVEVAKQLSHALAAGQRLQSPAELLAVAGDWLPGLDAAAGSAWWREQWRTGTAHLRVEGPELATEMNPPAAIRATADGAVSDASCRLRAR